MESDSGTISWMLKNLASNMLLSILKKIDGSKDIVLSNRLISVIDLICGYTLMKDTGVDKIFKLNNTPTYNNKKLCFIIKPIVAEIKSVCNWLNILQSKYSSNDLRFSIIFVPCKTFDCEKFLEQEGFFNCFDLYEFPLGFIPLDQDLFSLESDDLYHEYLLFGDHQFFNNIVQAMHQFQKIFGLMNIILIKGRAAEFVCDNLQKLGALSGLVESIDDSSNYHMDLFVVDREEDYVSLFLSQLNYTGILDETFEIKCGKIQYDPNIENPKEKTDDSEISTSTSLIKHNLFKSDVVFAEVKDMFFSSVCSSLKEKGQALKQRSYERQTMSFSEMKEFLNNEMLNLQSQHKMLFLHVNMCEFIMEKKKRFKFSDQLRIEQSMIEGVEPRVSLSFIENGIVKLYPPNQILRLISLYSICYGGLSNKDLHSLIKLFTQSYGYQYITVFYYLKKIGILFENSNQFNFISSNSKLNVAISTISTSTNVVVPSDSIKKFRHTVKKFNLIPLIEMEQYNPRAYTDCGYVFGGIYSPFFCKLTQNFLELKQFAQIDEWCKQNYCRLQPSLIPRQNLNRDLPARSQRIQIVFFVGGVTWAEVSAFRLLSKKSGFPIIVMTTSMINGNTFFQMFCNKLF